MRALAAARTMKLGRRSAPNSLVRRGPALPAAHMGGPLGDLWRVCRSGGSMSIGIHAARHMLFKSRTAPPGT